MPVRVRGIPAPLAEIPASSPDLLRKFKGWIRSTTSFPDASASAALRVLDHSSTGAYPSAEHFRSKCWRFVVNWRKAGILRNGFQRTPVLRRRTLACPMRSAQ
jgi:hypothetical protein